MEHNLYIVDYNYDDGMVSGPQINYVWAYSAQDAVNRVRNWELNEEAKIDIKYVAKIVKCWK